MSIANWEACSEEGSDVREVLTAIATRLPLLDKLDLRTRSYDMIDGVLAYKCVEVESLSFEVCNTCHARRVRTHR